ncbi:TPA: MlaE family ABC transporter permease [Serratia fonticola]|jgi:phospholipid/cholesterol/gamma-HCH transport system permease protein|uniref:Probable phospholipid ABC transporter permease protein mlaE n=1 Tax=Serratia fonticola TaxID=47917 RepID=A0A3S4YA53_SERFO|nr:ABC transporter permease [Serratia fonticola]CAI1553819.1 Probable phospholipid ABC transporter permease protein mlaE [Serratia fonticola]CAI1775733.1 Probable phospholipid ABC transporter permease protein mlaE [Serratia fonticola]CAI1784601.1 Probable phospholipid ABC transporter permease protein mlaE [Serratia fonticola]CAI2005525.1 Probable phospholipid ABC transporter permease protein mlaE [Serratia fonticola]VEI72783.1 Probable phospholipid ABC transporter permease protein mlaE [Serrat
MAEQQLSTFLNLDETLHPPRILASGDWVLAHYRLLEPAVGQLQARLPANVVFDLSQLGSLDTAGATLLVNLLGDQRISDLKQLAPTLPVERRVLLETVGRALQGFEPPPAEKPPGLAIELLANVGRSMENFWHNLIALLGFIGLTLQTLFASLLRPTRWRITSLVANLQQIGLNAVPIIMLLTFLVGAVIAFLGSTVLSTFGASIFTVQLVVFSFLREFAVLLTAILMAGRTASAFTAELGLMKANEEIDAIQAMGLNPVELLVLPRVLALLLALPMLTFIGMISGIFGGMVVCALTLDISPTMFLTITQSSGGFQNFLVGMSKAPVFAFLIAIIGCLEGFKVSGSAESVGAHTTASVVHSIFVVILLDAVAALFFMEMGV